VRVPDAKLKDGPPVEAIEEPETAQSDEDTEVVRVGVLIDALVISFVGLVVTDTGTGKLGVHGRFGL